ncbi:DUF1156 domain-containing protein [Rhodopirellula europaea]|uniref:Protein containing DUF1156 n=1 Tax=Rhodopirellula europaea 6C TaxID=1263867 RepID=M2AAF0_9BACT|nr:DUF1156 domain-containing protein [Rhodopirellula europaea]EMB13450.1 protein containing DUF1156 [Rhodopirellula europaea 6C]
MAPTPQQTTYRKKLIEVALPLEAINTASAREKSIRHGHPSTLHLWWARRPLAACRAVLFSSLVNDPDDDPMYGHDENVAGTEREKLHQLIRELVEWENSNNPDVINRARLEIARSIAANKVADGELEDDAQLVSTAPELPEEQAKYLPDPPPEYTPHDVRFKMPGLKPEQVNHFLAHYAPPVLDPFAGGGSIPLEAQRLGLRAYASDLNPVPVLINKALIEIPPRFAGQPPVNPDAQKGKLKNAQWNGAQGLAEDVRYYGKWMRDEAEKRIGHLYPKVKVTQQMVDDGRPDLEPYVGQELTVIAWLWARTVKSPNPAAKEVKVPLLSTFWVCKKKGKEAYIRPLISNGDYELQIKTGVPTDFDPNPGTVNRSGATCLVTESPIPFDHARDEGKSVGLGQRLTCIVAVAKRKRLYFSPSEEHSEIALGVDPGNPPDTDLPENALGFRVQLYGMNQHKKLFTDRQLGLLSCLTELVSDVHDKVLTDAEASGIKAPDEHARAVATYLGEAVSKSAAFHCTLASWRSKEGKSGRAFGRQNLAMTWDFAEVNPFANAGGALTELFDSAEKTIRDLPATATGTTRQCDATALESEEPFVISTDPPYYDNVGYADLSDFYYVWLRKGLSKIYPTLFGTMLTPKQEELIATPFRHEGGQKAAKVFFGEGLGKAIARMNDVGNSRFPVAIFYAFKQSETDTADMSTASTGWETFLEGIIKANYEVTGTWPMRTESTVGLKMSQNVLASSIVLVCRPRLSDASMVTRRDFANALRKELPEAIKHLQSGNVAPVDLAQASIGPGMAVFSRYSKVVNADGSPMSVREALQLINQVLDESLVEQESDFDAETRFALRWFEQYGMTEGPFGDAETLAKAMAVSVTGIVESGIAASGAGKVRLLKRDELSPDWAPETDTRLTMWEVAQYLIRSLENDGEAATGALLARIGSSNGEIARELAYRLYQTCEKKKLAEEARAYNGLVVSWPEIVKLSRQVKPQPVQTKAF